MPLDYPTLPGDIDHLIADDHAIVERQFQHLERGQCDRAVIVAQITYELALHSYAEQHVLYRVWDDIGLPGQKARALAEHEAIDELLDILSKSEAGSPLFERALAELMIEVRIHIAEEEARYLPQIRARVGDVRMSTLGKAFVAAKRKAPPARPIGRLRARLRGIDKQLATDATGLLHPEAQAIVDAHAALAPLPLEILDPARARRQPGPADAIRQLLKQQHKPTTPERVGSVEDIDIADATGAGMTLRVYRPVDVQPNAPILMWIHGGGWVLFTIDDHYDASCRALCNKTGAIVVTPEYRCAPEAPFPASHDDVLEAYRWTVANAEILGGDPTRIAIGGESVGGTMAAATVLQLASAGETIPVAMVCVYPVTTLEQYGESMVDSADSRPLNRAALSWMAMHAFAGQPEAAKDPRVDLLGWSDTQLALMPPTLVITSERDILRSQGQEFARKLAGAGVSTTSSNYPGTMHEFFGASAVCELAELAQQEAAAHLRRAFLARPELPTPIDFRAYAFERHARDVQRRR